MLKILDDLLPHKQSSWVEIEGALRRQFGENVTLEEVCEELADRQVGEGEKLGAFTADICHLTCHGYPSLAMEVQE